MSIVTVKFQPELHSGEIHRPAFYAVVVYTEDTRKDWSYILVGADFDEKKLEFTPIKGNIFEMYSDHVWRNPKNRKNKVHPVKQMGLNGQYLRDKFGAKVFEVTELNFGSSKVTPDDLIDMEQSRETTPYM
ncbi:hypothetical protein [Shimazuella alba]|uniref:Uncharacterized protein n=1 Tax=Shimazuella alba TaxID=2690964 RepID=A0A6I4VXA8_9BACL|nr:hypothetical protein [Shimazuella alba]MXQ54526.1 hypothetical protein [Shimazuella alba]